MVAVPLPSTWICDSRGVRSPDYASALLAVSIRKPVTAVSRTAITASPANNQRGTIPASRPRRVRRWGASRCVVRRAVSSMAKFRPCTRHACRVCDNPLGSVADSIRARNPFVCMCLVGWLCGALSRPPRFGNITANTIKSNL